MNLTLLPNTAMIGIQKARKVVGKWRWKSFSHCNLGRHGGPMFSVLDSGSCGLGFEPWPEAKCVVFLEKIQWTV